MEKDSEIYKGKKERIKSIALKAKKESSDDETSTSGSDDEEYAMAVRNFKKFFRRKGKFVRQPREEKKSFRQRDEKKGKSNRKCFRCGDPNHLIDDCPKPSCNKDQKASLEVCLRTCLEPDEWIKDSGCSKHMTGNKSLFSTCKAYDGGVFLGYSQNSKAYVVLNKHTMKVEESLDVTFDESLPPTKLSTLVDDGIGEEEAIKRNTKVVNNNNEEDESIEVDEIVNIKESKNHPLDQVMDISKMDKKQSKMDKSEHEIGKSARKQSRRRISFNGPTRLGSTSGIRAFALRNFDLEVMEFEFAHSNTTAKLPILKVGEYQIWVIRIKQYFQVQDYALWEVIENGNSWVSVPQTAQENGTLVTKMSVPVIAKEKTNKKNDVKARSLLLMALPNKHQHTFSQYNDAKTMFAAIEIRFRVITQEDLNSRFLSILPPEWNTHVVVWMNKAEIKTMSIDDLCNNFKIVKQSVKKSISASSGAQNLAFMTALSTSSTNDVNIAKPAYEVSTVSLNVNTASPQVSTASFSDNAVYAFMVENPNGSNLL
ncbi:retrovirus-related pol polyprotein from transposon TNT 1-94 [Tanacetum coccineum]